MLKIALTGGIATGKSYVLDQFRALGVPCLDADDLAHGVTGAGTQATLGATQIIKAVMIGADAIVTVASAGTNLQSGGKVLKTGSLAITGGRLNLANNNAIVDYTGSTPMAGVVTQLTTGRNGGGWNGAAGITSSSANSTTGLTALAVYLEIAAEQARLAPNRAPALFGRAERDLLLASVVGNQRRMSGRRPAVAGFARRAA